MKLIFLDFDEVMNSILYRKTSRKKIFKALMEEENSKYSMSEQPTDPKAVNFFIRKKSVDVDPIAMNLLNQLVTATDSKVVICSTWRNHYPFRNTSGKEEDNITVVGRFKMLFSILGYPNFPVIGVTGYTGFRGQEVAEYLDDISKTQKIDEYLIIDDGRDFFLEDLTKMNDKEISNYAMIHNKDGNPVFKNTKEFENMNPRFWSQQPLLCTSHLTGLTSTDVFNAIVYLNRKNLDDAYVLLDKSYERFKINHKIHNADIEQDDINDLNIKNNERNRLEPIPIINDLANKRKIN